MKSTEPIPPRSARKDVAGVPFDLISKQAVENAVAQRDAGLPFEYIVTPNVDHVVRNNKLGLRHLYEQAWLSVCDSRILAKLSPIVGVRFPDVITGSDLTRTVLERFVKVGDVVTIIGCDDEHVQLLRSKFPGVTVQHFNPPMGFIKKEAEVQRAVRFVVDNPARYVFLAVGSPQQELLSQAIKRDGGTGLGLCIGASILFVTGGEQRAPQWVQKLNMEWLYRLLQNPKRLWRRYLVEDPVIFGLILRQRMGWLKRGEK